MTAFSGRNDAFHSRILLRVLLFADLSCPDWFCLTLSRLVSSRLVLSCVCPSLSVHPTKCQIHLLKANHLIGFVFHNPRCGVMVLHEIF